MSTKYKIRGYAVFRKDVDNCWSVLIPVEKFGNQPILPNSESDTFDEVKELREIAKDLPMISG
jgi:hypothetical protein